MISIYLIPLKHSAKKEKKIFGIRIVDASVSYAIKHYEGRYKNLVIQYIYKELLYKYKNDEKYIFYENNLVKETHL